MTMPFACETPPRGSDFFLRPRSFLLYLISCHLELILLLTSLFAAFIPDGFFPISNYLQILNIFKILSHDVEVVFYVRLVPSYEEGLCPGVISLHGDDPFFKFHLCPKRVDKVFCKLCL